MLWRTPTPSRSSVTALSAALCPPAFEMEETRAQRPRRSGAPYRPEQTEAEQTEAEQTEAGQAGDCHAIRKTAVRLIVAVFVLPWLAPVAAADLTGAEVAQADFTNDSARGAYLSICQVATHPIGLNRPRDRDIANSVCPCGQERLARR